MRVEPNPGILLMFLWSSFLFKIWFWSFGLCCLCELLLCCGFCLCVWNFRVFFYGFSVLIVKLFSLGLKNFGFCFVFQWVLWRRFGGKFELWGANHLSVLCLCFGLAYAYLFIFYFKTYNFFRGLSVSKSFRTLFFGQRMEFMIMSRIWVVQWLWMS